MAIVFLMIPPIKTNHFANNALGKIDTLMMVYVKKRKFSIEQQHETSNIDNTLRPSFTSDFIFFSVLC